MSPNNPKPPELPPIKTHFSNELITFQKAQQSIEDISLSELKQQLQTKQERLQEIDAQLEEMQTKATATMVYAEKNTLAQQYDELSLQRLVIQSDIFSLQLLIQNQFIHEGYNRVSISLAALRTVLTVYSEKDSTKETDVTMKIILHASDNLSQYETDLQKLFVQTSSLDQEIKTLSRLLAHLQSTNPNASLSLIDRISELEAKLTRMEHDRNDLFREIDNLDFNFVNNLERSNPDLYYQYQNALKKFRTQQARDNFMGQIGPVSFLVSQLSQV